MNVLLEPISCDLFAGCGGFSLGFKKAGFKIVSAIDYYEPAIDTYRYNIGNHIIYGDITNKQVFNVLIDDCLENGVEMIEGSPPCQGFSLAGLRNIIDKRNFRIKDYYRVINRVKPKMFLMENVNGILTSRLLVRYDREVYKYFKIQETISKLNLRLRHKKNDDKLQFRIENLKAIMKRYSFKYPYKFTIPVIEYIQRINKKIGYNIKIQELNAVDYGIPQMRKRVFVMGIRKDYNVLPTFPKPDHSCIITKRYDGKIIPKYKTVKDAIDDLKNTEENKEFSHVFTKSSDEFKERIKNVKSGDSLYEFKQGYRRLSPYTPSPCILENHGGVLIHYEKDRFLTPRELARLQTFPDSFIFKGNKSQTLKLIGNAVPYLLSYKLAIHVKKILGNLN